MRGIDSRGVSVNIPRWVVGDGWGYFPMSAFDICVGGWVGGWWGLLVPPARFYAALRIRQIP